MATDEDTRRILDHLQPIFPQMSAYYLVNCIREVKSRVGDDRAAIISNCIDDILLAGTATELQEPPPPVQSQASSTQQEVDDDVIYMGSSIPPRARRQAFLVINDENSEGGNSLEVQAKDQVPTITIDAPPYTRRDPTRVAPDLNINLDPIVPESAIIVGKTSKTCIFSGPATSSLSNTGMQDLSDNEFLEHTRQIETNIYLAPRTINVAAPAVEVKETELNFLKEVSCMFPQVDEDYLKQLRNTYSDLPVSVAINNACNLLLEKRDFPKKQSSGILSPECAGPPEKSKEEIDYFKDFSDAVPWNCRAQCLTVLQHDFPTLSMKDIRMALSKFNHHYAPARKCLEESILTFGNAQQNASSTNVLSSPFQKSQTAVQVGETSTSSKSTTTSMNLIRVTFLKRRRSPSKMPLFLEPQLKKEIDFFKSYKLMKSEEEDRKLAFLMNEKEYEDEGQKIECGCCFGEVTFEAMVQCLDGHLFCADCLKNYAKEAVYGSAKAMLMCMTDGCESTFPVSQLQKALPVHILTKYEDRMQEESLLLAEMEDLVRCPSCDYAAVLPPEDKVFKCQACAKETCRFCKEEWSEHFGLKCSEVEKKNTRDVRLSYEEKMTMAKIRKCTKCGCEFTKSDGCNKMTCRCGTTQCYICRKPQISYPHFCQHPKDPGKACSKCNRCNLWSDPSEDDDRAVKELEKEAENAKRELEEAGAVGESNPVNKKPRLLAEVPKSAFDIICKYNSSNLYVTNGCS